MRKMITKPFYLLKKILFTTKFTTNLKKNPFYNKSQTIKSHFLEKILLTTNQTTKVKHPFLIATPIQTTSFLLKPLYYKQISNNQS